MTHHGLIQTTHRAHMNDLREMHSREFASLRVLRRMVQRVRAAV